MAAYITEQYQLLLRPGTPSAAVHALAAREGWRLMSHQPRARAIPDRHEWEAGDGLVDLTEDHESGHRLVGVYNSRALLDRLVTQLPLLDERAVLDLARTLTEPLTRMRLLRVLSYLQVAAALEARKNAPVDPAEPKYEIIADDTRYLDLFAAGLSDPEPAIRRAAIDALGHSCYPGARTILREHRDRLPDHAEVIDFYLGRPLLRFLAPARPGSEA